MTFASPLALLWLLAVPAVVALHLFRRRLEERRVAALFLFPVERLVASAGRTRTRLLHTPSLWLESLAALALALWLAGPSFAGAPARHVVFVLDDSASMAAGGARAAAAAVRDAAADLSAGDRVTVLRTGVRPETLLGPAASPGEVGVALARWAPAQNRHDPLPALDLARGLAGGAGEVVFCTDGPPPPRCSDVTVLAFGAPAPNCAIVGAQRVPRASGEELRVKVIGTGGAAGAEIEVLAGERSLLRAPLVFTDGAVDFATPLPPGTGTVHLRLPGDALAIDDEAWLLPAPERRVSVCDLLPAEASAAMGMQRVFAALGGVHAVTDPRDAELVLAEAPGAVRPGQLEVVFVPDAKTAVERDAWRGPFAIDRAHAWLAGVQLQGVVWVAARRPLPGQVLVAANEQPLVCEEFLDAGRRLWLDVDPRTGNLVRSPDWPVLWSNVVESARAEAPGVEEPNALVGAEARYRRSLRAGAADAEVALEHPNGTRTIGRGARTVAVVLAQPGVHRFVDRDGASLGEVAARFLDPEESDLRGLVTGKWPAAPQQEARLDTTRDTGLERRLLALALLLFVSLDWWLLAGQRAPGTQSGRSVA